MTSPASQSALVFHAGRVTVEERGAGSSVLCLTGEHDIANVDELAECIADVMALDDADLVLDLSEVQFMSAATVRVLVRARARLRRQSRALVLLSPSRPARRILELCGFGDQIDADSATAGMPRRAGALGSWVAVPVRARPETEIVESADERSDAVASSGGP